MQIISVLPGSVECATDRLKLASDSLLWHRSAFKNLCNKRKSDEGQKVAWFWPATHRIVTKDQGGHNRERTVTEEDREALGL